MILEIVSPEATLFKGEITSITKSRSEIEKRIFLNKQLQNLKMWLKRTQEIDKRR